jgi:hypothetical protein
MRMAAGLAAAVIVGALGPAAHAELDPAETKWLKQCVDAFGAKSDRVRDGACAAAAKLGLEAVPGLVAEAARLKSDDQWNALTKSLELMGAKDAANAVDMARDRWPKGQEQRLGALVVLLRKPAPDVKPAPGVDAKVRELLEPFRTAHMYSSDELAVRRVIALGRAAIPALVAMLRESDHEHGPGMLNEAATDALAGLVNESDVPILAQLLEEGRLVATRAFVRVRSPAVLDALLDTVKRGFVSHDLVQGLEGYANDARVAATLVAWVEAQGARAGWELSPVAEFLGHHRVAAAVPGLLKTLDARLEGHALVSVSVALSSLGRREGIEALLSVMENGAGGLGRSDDYVRHEAGEALNRIANRRIYSGTFEPGAPLQGNADDAAKQFRAWWDEVKDKIRFDETRRAWVVD